MDGTYLDWALTDFSGYVAIDELYDGPFCVLSIVDKRIFKRLIYQVLSHDPITKILTPFCSDSICICSNAVWQCTANGSNAFCRFVLFARRVQARKQCNARCVWAGNRKCIAAHFRKNQKGVGVCNANNESHPCRRLAGIGVRPPGPRRRAGGRTLLLAFIRPNIVKLVLAHGVLDRLPQVGQVIVRNPIRLGNATGLQR